MEVMEGKKYKHFKGHIYKVLKIAKDSEDLKPLVVYENVQNGEVWVRPLSEFVSLVDKNKYPEACQEYRFTLVD